ncbi:metallophosphoesterase [Phaeobacter sp. B1627]|uniref:metallophosphoesterase n=1 Tax=Phaeobacter sp. B1627 TaxID=2583809 RepID=UPI00111A57C1|nr:metallophosphoesterase [Phaeobacter sp. B1627]TNJ43017.1 serine/threonine protein phosphatase [Phaeobacter sp. B1627]
MLVTWATEKLGLTKKFSPVAPDEPLCVIGDIHGRYDLFRRILDRLPADHKIICVGDYVDRGEDSARVLRFLIERPDILCLQGNHEKMLLRFLRNPAQNGRHWLDHGGLQTLASFGVPRLAAYMKTPDLVNACDFLSDRMGELMINWLSYLPTSFRSGNVLVAHAGADPRKPVDEQTDSVLQWGHPDFLRTARKDGQWVVHGHTIVSDPKVHNGRISIDTGAYATGRLTAVQLDGKTHRFISVP